MLTVIVTITRGLNVRPTVSVMIMGRYIGNASNYCDNNDNNGEVYMYCCQLV